MSSKVLVLPRVIASQAHSQEQGASQINNEHVMVLHSCRVSEGPVNKQR